MTREELKHVYLYATKAFVFVSLFSPLVVSAYFFFPFIVPKTLFFQIAVSCALFFYALLVACDRTYAPKFDMLTKIIGVWFLVWVIAAALGANPARSFFGSYERMLSVVNLAHFVALYLIMRAVFRSSKEWLVLLRVFLGVSMLVGLYGIGQKLGFSFLYHANIDRIDSTIGNAAFLAGYCIFAIFFALFAFARDKHPWFRIFYLCSIPLNLLMIYFSETRGAVLGLLAGAVCLIGAYAVRPRETFSVRLEHLWKTISVMAVVLFAVFLLEKGSGGLYQSFQRFSSVSLSDATVQTRILAVRTSTDGFLARPVLGWGPENYNLVFDAYYNPKLYPTENWFDHAHNILFDVATSTGVVGLLVYFLFLSIVLMRIVAYARAAAAQYWAGAALVALVAAYGVQNLFVFDSLVTYLPLFMLCALIGAECAPSMITAGDKKGKQQSFAKPSFVIVLALVPVFAAGIYWVDVRPALGAYNAVVGFSAPPEYALSAIDYFDRAVAYSNFGREEIRGKVVEYINDVLDSEALAAHKDVQQRLAEYAVAEMEKGIAEEPMNFRNYLYFANFLGNKYDVLSSYGIPAVEKADAALARAEPLAPKKPILYLQWGRIRTIHGDMRGAVAVYEKAVALNPDVIESRMRLAAAYQRAGEKDKALGAYQAIAAANKGVGAQTYVDLAVGFASIDAFDEAITAAQKAAALDPTLAREAEVFTQKIRKKMNAGKK